MLQRLLFSVKEEYDQVHLLKMFKLSFQKLNNWFIKRNI